jgi:Xaa-Pro aminopeptidase
MTTTAVRLAAARDRLERTGIDVMLLSVGSDLPYLVDYRAMPFERLTMLVVPAEGEATLVLPELEAPRVDRDDSFRMVAWGETADPVAIVADLARPAARVAVGDETWATFLIRLQDEMPGARFESASALMSALRIRKDDTEIQALRAAGAAVDGVVEQLEKISFRGKRERDLAREIAELTLDSGHESADFAIVASGPNGASPHHEPGERVMGPGDGVVVDFGGRMNRYWSDNTRTFVIGAPDGEFRRAYDVLERAQHAAVEAVAPGVPAAAVDRAAREVIDEAGYGERFIHRTGHGIGLDTHEDPYIVEGNETPLEPAMAFSVEPGIYVPGAWGMRIEDIVTVTASGVERLNRSHRQLRIVD